ncbi:ABC transporter substrate-binding protein [Candidatus Gottesmanbacteria bacterium]|nr:ABC transporter substrate-binding protein [Candidatus Gottesmanbacteria bacterium]
MFILRKIRLFFWVIRILATKYTKALAGGFIIGLCTAFLLSQMLPLIKITFFAPIERIGIVGEFTPSTLPRELQDKVSAGLTSLAPDGSAKESLAISWEATDSGKVYIFHLRSDLFWHDGKKVEANDVNYNIKNVTFSPIDNKTIRVILTESYSPFPTVVAKPLFKKGLIGFGPYRVSSIKLSGDSVQYLLLTPRFERLGISYEYRFYKTQSQAVSAFKRGDVDRINDLSDALLFSSWGTANLTEQVLKDRMVTLFYNTKDSMLKEKQVRQMLSYAVPDLGGERAYSPIGKGSWSYTDKIRKYDPNTSQALKMAKSLGIASESSELTITTFPGYVDVASKIATAWTNIGIKTSVQVENSLSGTFQVLLGVQIIPPDPDQYPFWHSTQTVTNVTGYINQKIDKLLEDGRGKNLDPENRRVVYQTFARTLTEDVPALFLYYPTVYSIHR